MEKGVITQGKENESAVRKISDIGEEWVALACRDSGGAEIRVVDWDAKDMEQVRRLV